MNTSLFGSIAAVTLAALPEPGRDIINAALASGGEDTVRAIIEFTRTTNPDDADELDTSSPIMTLSLPPLRR